VAEPANLAAAWPPEGPKQLWRRTLGDGYSAISVAGGRLFTMYRRAEQEVVVALDAAAGTTAWEHAYDAPFSREYDVQNGPGPHATPLVAGGRVFAVGATGVLHALDERSGRVLWRRDLIREFGATPRPTGYACSPIAYGDTLILFVGGKGQAVVAFRQSDGRVARQSGDFRNSASSPLLIDVAGEPQLVAFLYDAITGFDPRDGRLLWRHPHVTEFGLNVSLPVWGEDGLLFVSAAYGGGSRVLRVTREAGRPAVEELWHSRLMRLHFGNAVRLGDFVVGSSGDFGPAPLTAIDVRTGQVLWRNRSLARASLLRAGDRLILLDEDGQLALASATREGLQVHAKSQLFDGRSWTVPTLDGAVLYARDRKSIVAPAPASRPRAAGGSSRRRPPPRQATRSRRPRPRCRQPPPASTSTWTAGRRPPRRARTRATRA
jgi:outer membrane protein assembly factor BamB